MLSLKLTDFMQIQHWFVDYQKKSRNYEMPPEYAQIWGIYDNDKLVGYFITVAHKTGIVEINQGYLSKEARHKKNQYIAMSLLEKTVKQYGMTKVVLGTNRAVGSYQRFMRNMGYSLVRAEFSKTL